MRLTGAEKRRIKREHPIVEVLGRMGIDPPPYWDGTSEFRIRAAAVGFPHGSDDSQGVLIKPAGGRWWAFHGGFGGDVLELVRRAIGVNSLSEAAAVLDARRRIAVDRSDGQIDTAAVLGWSERPDPLRTSIHRILQVNAEAWRFVTLPRLAGQARAYLHFRGIDLAALEAEAGHPLAGLTPSRKTGLVEYLRVRGFSDDEIVDAGWGTRRPDLPLRDRYRHRVLLPFRDDLGHVLGVTGRDVTGAATAKYLNHPRTLAFDKSAVLYRPSTPALDLRATVIVCEGTLDALAIAAAAARTRVSNRYAPVTQSGLSLTDRVAPRVFGLHPRPVVLCGDGDPAGQKATAAWVDRAIRVHHREVLTVSLPDGLDPADWLVREGDAGLLAFTRPGCLEDRDRVRPRPAGGLIARHELDRAMEAARTRKGDVETVLVVRRVIDRLGQLAGHLADADAVERFAREAGASLAELVDGQDAVVRTRQVLEATRQRHSFRSGYSASPQVREAVMSR